MEVDGFCFLNFIYLTLLGLLWGTWGLVPQPGIELRPSALGAWSFSSQEVLVDGF